MCKDLFSFIFNADEHIYYFQRPTIYGNIRYKSAMKIMLERLIDWEDILQYELFWDVKIDIAHEIFSTTGH